ncbi:glycoside hydrolase family 43 protein [Cohnella candidum]|uniref:Glycoside hydrolase family 43 protein n=1 Tax=Cohnella candidum TaxID=2674991 RepID=A0A3G3JTL0_9BACL|nr:glycoside hydrolase family 43 protein [Cohnella candidum]AYQ71555.1 glycoside hydrolase family 43 protein [Cohnella candidum]
MPYSNPVLPGFYPDPSICRVGSDYYLVTSSFQFFPGVPIFHSRDLVHWRQIGHCLERESQLDLEGCKSSLGIFAPTIRHHDGRFYMVTTNTNGFRNFFVWADKPEGPWSEPVWLDWPGIDPSLFFDDDGRVYLTGTGGFLGNEPLGIYQAEIEIDTGRLLSDRKFIWSGTGGKAPEGPHLYKIEGIYYLLIAEGGTEYGHMVTIARSDSPYGPFEICPGNPILTHRSTDSPIQATGHADLVETEDGSWWAVFLGIRPAPFMFRGLHHHLGRETFLAPVSWSSDGWPMIGDAGKAALTMDAETLPLGQAAVRPPAKDDFENGQLPFYWNFLRNPAEGSWTLDDRPGWLTLYGSAPSLDDAGAPAFVGRRQQHFDCAVSAKLSFDPVKDGEEAGLTVYRDEKFHYEIALAHRNGTRKVILRRRVGSLWKVELEEDYDASEIVLGIEADASRYSFYFASPGGERKTFGFGECSFLSSEVAGGFTGVYFAMYATGNGQPCSTSAAFDWFEYIPTNE